MAGSNKNGNSTERQRATRAACWQRGQLRKERNRKENEELRKAKQARRDAGALTKTDLMWQDVKDKFEGRRREWEVERNASDWCKRVGRVKGKRITMPKLDKDEPKPEDNGKAPKPRQKRPKKEKVGA